MPSRIDTSALFSAYREQQGTRATRRKVELAEAAAKRRAAIEQVKRIGRTKRAAIKLLGGGPVVKRLNYALAARRPPRPPLPRLSPPTGGNGAHCVAQFPARVE
ncbi:hypothetical protein [Tardibacter chloracetimidivorans]|uniref:hypothetical protein n=1 Tax=Tardibacter chloracetimidivorans TaxID=1921510 RepID=UPI000A94C1C0|nr:hypothetical protein [Tardibacter chloracetimidivorans]